MKEDYKSSNKKKGRMREDKSEGWEWQAVVVVKGAGGRKVRRWGRIQRPQGSTVGTFPHPAAR